MYYARQTTGLIHREHVETIGLLERLDTAFASHRPGRAPSADDRTLQALLRDVAGVVENEVGRHFAFEQNALFPILSEAGDGDIAALLQEEHAAILPLGTRLAQLAREAQHGGFKGDDWAEFFRLGRELIERQIAHIQKEEMSLLPLLESALTDAVDIELANAYLAAQ